jgi:hypothetical protein
VTASRWPLAALAMLGPAFGALMVLGVGNPTQPLLWLAACGLAARVLVERPRGVWAWEALALALAWGTLHNVVESIWFEAYLTNNPGYADRLSNPAWLPARCWVLVTGPLAGLGVGIALVGGVAAWRARRARRRGARASPSERSS